jgi:hypothetical protein
MVQGPHENEPESARTSCQERQPYEPPAIRWEEGFDVRPNLMAACGQKPEAGGDCNFVPAS